MNQLRSNLPANTWSRLLLDNARLETVAAEVTAGRIMPWNSVLVEACRGARSVLDLGSGRGEHAATLALSGKDVTLLDWAEDNLRFSRELFARLGVRGRFCRADLTSPLPFRALSHDVVFSVGVLEFFSDSQIEQVVSESWRVCSQKLVVLVPNAFSAAYRIGKWWMERTGRWDWDGEVPFRSFTPYLRRLPGALVTEYSVAPRHALKFLTGSVGRRVARVVSSLLPSEESQPAFLRQGYLLVATAERH